MNNLPSAASGSIPALDAHRLFSAQSYSEWGRNVIRLRGLDPGVTVLFDTTMSEPTAELMESVRQALLVTEDRSRYVSVFAEGNPYAVQALGRRYGFSPEQIITTTGATSGVQLVLSALLQPGDEVLVERPGFAPHLELVRRAGGAVVNVDRPAPTFRVSWESLESNLTARTRAMLITNLHNPSGAHLPAGEITALAQRLATVGAVLIVDEVYADFAARPSAAGSLGPNVLSVSSLTKVYGLFALKFGWIAGSRDLIADLRARAPDGDPAISKLTQAVAAHVLEAIGPFDAHWRDTLQSTRPVVAAAAAEMQRAGLLEGEVPPFGCLYFPRIPGVTDTIELARRLFAEHALVVAPGEFFGAPGHLRIGFGTAGQGVEAAMQRLARGLAALR